MRRFLISILCLLASAAYADNLPLLGVGSGGGSLGPVVFDAKGTLQTSGAATSVTDISITVGSGSKRGLLYFMCWPTGSIPAALAVTWNGVSMTQVASGTNGSNNTCVIMGLANPASGNNTLSASWTGSTQVYAIGASYTGVDQTGGTTSFPNGTSNVQASTSTCSVAVTSGTNHIAAAAHQQGGGTWGAISGTTLFSSVALSLNAAANYDVGAATTTLTAALNTPGACVSVGVDIKAG